MVGSVMQTRHLGGMLQIGAMELIAQRQDLCRYCQLICKMEELAKLGFSYLDKLHSRINEKT